MVLGAVSALCEFSLHASQLSYYDRFHNALDNTLNRFYNKKGIFQKQTMSKSAIAKVDKQLARESLQLQKQKIHMLYAAIEVQVYGA